MWWLVAGCDDGTSALRGALEREGFEVVGLAVGESGALSWTAQRDGQVCQGVAKGSSPSTEPRVCSDADDLPSLRWRCDHRDDAAACTLLGQAGVEPTARFERACELGDGAGCRERGRQLRGVYEGYLCDTGSEGWYERGAELGDAGSWSDLGYWREVCPKDLAAARAAYRRACELSDTAGCDHLADLDRRKPAGRAPKGNRP